MYLLPLFPLNTVLFPGTPISLHIFEPRYREMTAACLEDDRPFGVVLIQHGQELLPGQPEPYPVGCTAHIMHSEKLDDGRYNLTAVGEERFRIRRLEHGKPYLQGWVDNLFNGSPRLSTLRRIRPLSALVVDYLRFLSRISDLQLDLERLQMPEDPLMLIYLAASLLQIPPHEKQPLLELDNPAELEDLVERMYRREKVLAGFMGESDTATARRAAWLN